MKLERLVIDEQPFYSKDAGQYRGEILFKTEKGKVQVNLTHLDCERLFAVVADGIVKSAKEVAQNLTASVFESKLAVENKGNGE